MTTSLPRPPGSTLNHWPFPSNHLHEGYAYILTHPGTPTVFYDHFYQEQGGLRKAILELMAIRTRNGLNCRCAPSSPPDPQPLLPRQAIAACRANKPAVHASELSVSHSHVCLYPPTPPLSSASCLPFPTSLQAGGATPLRVTADALPLS